MSLLPASSVDWIIVIILGAAAGFGELLARYRDAPKHVLRSKPALLYVAFNGAIAAAALWVTRVFGWTFGIDGAVSSAVVRTTQVMVAGLGSMALFRSTLFNIKVGDQEVGIGPRNILQVALNAIDREVDRRRAEVRARTAEKIMNGVSFTKAQDVLPAYCLALMQNLPDEDQQKLGTEVKALIASALSEHAKTRVLGLVIMNAVGEEVLSAAVSNLGDHIR